VNDNVEKLLLFSISSEVKPYLRLHGGLEVCYNLKIKLYLKLIFFIFLYLLNMLILKINIKIYKLYIYYFNIFQNKKILFKKSLIPKKNNYAIGKLVEICYHGWLIL
jgi:hypothetical protein